MRRNNFQKFDFLPPLENGMKSNKSRHVIADLCVKFHQFNKSRLELNAQQAHKMIIYIDFLSVTETN